MSCHSCTNKLEVGWFLHLKCVQRLLLVHSATAKLMSRVGLDESCAVFFCAASLFVSGLNLR